MSKKMLRSIAWASILVLGGCGGQQTPPAVANNSPQDETPPLNGLTVSRAEMEAYYAEDLQTSFTDRTRPSRPKRTVSGEKNLIIVELLGDDDDLGEIKLTFSWSMDPKTGMSNKEENKQALLRIGQLIRRFNLPAGIFGDLYKGAIEENWSIQRGGRWSMETPRHEVRVEILPLSTAKAKKFQGKGLFVTFRVRAR